MLSSTLEKALNHHVNREAYSAHLYLAMSAYCESIKMSGSAHWMRAQAQEEWTHAMKMFAYVVDRGGRVKIEGIEEPQGEYKSLLDAFEKTLEHEQEVSATINALYEKALQEKDFATQAFLQWFVTEQVEEEKTAGEIVDQLRMLGTSSTGLIMMDRHLATR